MSSPSLDHTRNPQASQMADESMVRTLAAQISAIWPQELPLLDRYRGAARVLDVGAGTGEFSSRLAQLWPEATVTGVDVLSSSVELARNRHQALAPRLQFEQGDAFQLQYPEGSFDLVACRHVLQAIPTPELVISELARVLRPGGYAHILTEDYGMLHMMVAALDPDELWRDGPVQYAARTNTDARIGRRTWSLMRQAGFIDLRVDYVIVDTVRVERTVFADIMRAWRDGYVEALASGSSRSPEWFRAGFDQVIASIEDPEQYAVWMVPIVSGTKA